MVYGGPQSGFNFSNVFNGFAFLGQQGRSEHMNFSSLFSCQACRVRDFREPFND